MTRLEALKELHEKVKAGSIPDTGSDRWYIFDSGVGVYVDHGACRARDAYFGSLDAAKALHEAVLPEWGWEINRLSAVVQGPTAQRYFGQQSSDKQSRLWLLAILQALIAQEQEQE